MTVRRTLMKAATPLVALGLLGAACAGRETTGASSPSPATSPAAPAATKVAAADLRAGLTGLLSEHVYLAALATGAALRGDTAAFNAAAAALNGPKNSNTADIVAAVTSVYGAEVGKAFDGLWRSEGHIPAFVAYTQAVAAGDEAKADKAVADLLAYAKTFGTTMNSVNENLPAAAVEEAITMHITDLKAVVDAQKAKDQTKVYSSLRNAYHHMADTATVLAEATAKKFPNVVEGDARSKSADLQAGLTLLLREHVLLASSATGGALRGDTAAFNAAAAALNGPKNSNTADIVAAVTSVYGAEVGKAFDGLWRSQGHIPAFVAYTQAVAGNDQAAADKAVGDLVGYAKTFGTTMNSVNENLPAAAVEEAITMHATTLKAVVDAQKAKDPVKTATDLREAVHHMSGTASVLAGATVKKFPETFAG
ncbi:MAG: hypothetical protein ACRDJO_05250 [Actinomycetota bacterium]